MHAIVRTLAKVLGSLPLPVRQVLGRFLGFLVFLVPTRDRRVAVLHVRTMLPEKPAWRTVAAMYANLGQSALESLDLKPFLDAPEKYITFANWEYIRSLTDRGLPVIGLTAHLGNWDLLAAYVIRRGVPLATVGRKVRNRAMQATASKRFGGRIGKD
jgi:Kdo2-lipid IVA lauroyltransferase/acyltransferase